MKNIFVLSLLISFTLICSCQKQDSVAEQQLAQRKTELDTRETALDEREKDLSLRETALKERENALAKKEKIAANARTAPDAQSQDALRDAAAAKAERDRRIQQLPPELRAMIPDPSQMNAARAEKNRMAQERLAETQRRQEQSHSQKQPGLKGSGAVFPAPPVSSPAVEDVSPAPASSVEAASPSVSPTPE